MQMAQNLSYYIVLQNFTIHKIILNQGQLSGTMKQGKKIRDHHRNQRALIPTSLAMCDDSSFFLYKIK